MDTTDYTDSTCAGYQLQGPSAHDEHNDASIAGAQGRGSLAAAYPEAPAPAFVGAPFKVQVNLAARFRNQLLNNLKASG